MLFSQQRSTDNGQRTADKYLVTNGEQRLFRQQREFEIARLHSGGIITNYYCTSACGHCLYNCSPRWKREYIGREELRQILQKVQNLGCHSVHIGGGEPFLNLDGLETVVEVVCSMSVNIEYVETNSSWFRRRQPALNVLSALKEKGLSNVLISMSPFHNEHVPFYKVKGVIEACKEARINVFPWISEFYPEIDAFDDQITHALFAYENRYGENYLAKIPSRYSIHFGGRALKTFARIYGTKDYRDIVSVKKGGCSELLDVSHFQIDLFGNYIPGLCSGLAIRYEHLGDRVAREEYPFLTTLYHDGIKGFLDLAVND